MMVKVALAVLLLGIIYVLVNRPSAAPKNVTGPSTSNAVFGVIGNLGSNLINAFSTGNKVAPPGGVDTGTGNTGLNSLSSDQYDALAQVDQSQGVEGPF